MSIETQCSRERLPEAEGWRRAPVLMNDTVTVVSRKGGNITGERIYLHVDPARDGLVTFTSDRASATPLVVMSETQIYCESAGLPDHRCPGMPGYCEAHDFNNQRCTPLVIGADDIFYLRVAGDKPVYLHLAHGATRAGVAAVSALSEFAPLQLQRFTPANSVKNDHRKRGENVVRTVERFETVLNTTEFKSSANDGGHFQQQYAGARAAIKASLQAFSELAPWQWSSGAGDYAQKTSQFRRVKSDLLEALISTVHRVRNNTVAEHLFAIDRDELNTIELKFLAVPVDSEQRTPTNVVQYGDRVRLASSNEVFGETLCATSDDGYECKVINVDSYNAMPVSWFAFHCVGGGARYFRQVDSASTDSSSDSASAQNSANQNDIGTILVGKPENVDSQLNNGDNVNDQISVETKRNANATAKNENKNGNNTRAENVNDKRANSTRVEEEIKRAENANNKSADSKRVEEEIKRVKNNNKSADSKRVEEEIKRALNETTLRDELERKDTEGTAIIDNEDQDDPFVLPWWGWGLILLAVIAVVVAIIVGVTTRRASIKMDPNPRLGFNR